MTRFFNALLAFGLLAVFAAGCNVFEGLYEEGSSDDPAVLEADADLALQRGEADKAVQYLEKAHEKEPENPKIRTKLSTAILQANDVNVVKMIGIAEEISGNDNFGKRGFASTGRGVTGKSDALACNFASGRGVEQIALSNNSAFQEIKAVVNHLRRVQELLTPVVTNQSRMNELSTAQQQTALLNSAISEVLLVLVDVEDKKNELGAALWRLDNSNVGVCAADDSALIEIQSFVKCEQIPRMQNALTLLQRRLGGTGDGSGASEAIDEIQDNIDLLASEIQVAC